MLLRKAVCIPAGPAGRNSGVQVGPAPGGFVGAGWIAGYPGKRGTGREHPAEFSRAFLEVFGNKATTIEHLRAVASNTSDPGGILQTRNICFLKCRGEKP